MIKVGRAYSAKNGRRFLILAKKNRPASNGCNFVGEDVKSGVIAYFSHNGEHSFSPDLCLNVDPYKWIGIRHDGGLGSGIFVTKERLEGSFKAYFMIEDDDYTTVKFVSEEGFALAYM